MRRNCMFLSIIVSVLLIFPVILNAQLTAAFSADNCYAVYLGDQNGVVTKILPQSGYGVVNDEARKIFNATTASTHYSPTDWFYIIAWSDDSACQGLIGEFTSGAQVLRTGDAGWQVYGTKKNKDPASAPPTPSEINAQITSANASDEWEAPVVGPTNAMTTTVCQSYRRAHPVRGISDEAKWVWHDTKRHSHGDAPFQGYNHDEYLIFRFPVELVSQPGPSEPSPYDFCCPPVIKDDLAEMLNISGNLTSYRTRLEFNRTFENQLRAYAAYVMATNPCFTNVTIEYVIREPVTPPNIFNFHPDQVLMRGGTVFHQSGKKSNWGNADLSGMDLQTNKWYRLDMVFYGGPNSCPNWNFSVHGCDVISLEFNIETRQLRSMERNSYDANLKEIKAGKFMPSNGEKTEKHQDAPKVPNLFKKKK